MTIKSSARNRIGNIQAVERQLRACEQYDQVIHYPDLSVRREKLMDIIEPFMEKDENPFDYHIDVRIDHDKKRADITLLPITNSA